MKYIITTLVFYLTLSVNVLMAQQEMVADTILVDENVTYEFAQDTKNVYLNVRTADEKTIMSMLHLGVSVFFDIKGKKKQNVFVKYPAEPIEPVERRGNRNRKRPSGEEKTPEGFEEEANRRKQMIIKTLENDYSQKAIYSYFNDSEEFNILFNTLDVAVAYEYNEVEGEFTYKLQLPKNKINLNTKKSFDKLTIGIMTLKPERSKENKGGLNGSLGGLGIGQNSSRGGGRQGGGPPSGGRQGGDPPGGGQRGQRDGSPQGPGQESPAETLLDFWFKAEID